MLGHVTDQEREDITSSAQHALRLIAYNQIYKILGINRLPDQRPPGSVKPNGGVQIAKGNQSLKRPHPGGSPVVGGQEDGPENDGTTNLEAMGHPAPTADSSGVGHQDIAGESSDDHVVVWSFVGKFLFLEFFKNLNVS